MPNVYTYKDFEGSSHRILLDVIRRNGTGGILLDLGAAGGELGDVLRKDYDRTIGYEFELERIGQLHGRFDQVVIADLERTIRLPRGARTVVLADVLEHLKDPAQTLGIVRESIDPAGRIFVSVPNIANITIRLGLLFGIFTYRDRGILDATHLRFYTMRTIRREIEAAGFVIDSIHGSSVPIRLIIGKFTPEPILRIGERMLTWITRVWKALFAYQFILVARPRSGV
ncbi:MAG: class I SAM-dependent methyltransferase [Thermoanaerobaculia bacterium]